MARPGCILIKLVYFFIESKADPECATHEASHPYAAQ